MKRATQNISVMILPVLILFGFNTQAEEAQSPGVAEVFQCSYNDGKDWDDLMSTRDYFLKQSDKAGITPPPSYVWSRYKGGPPLDFIWFSIHADLAAFGANADAGAASSDMASVLPRFYTVASCREELGTMNTVFQRDGGDGPVFLSSYACNYRPGAGPGSQADLNSHIVGALEAMGDNAPQAVYTIEPITSGPNSRDVYLFDVHQSATAWTNFQGTIVGEADGQALARHFEAVLDCDQSLWNAQQVVGGDG
ncbi:MAG: hypothetical protein VB948_12885 [Pseudomonadales bacterium]